MALHWGRFMSDVLGHQPVLQTVASELLSLRAGESVLDVTLGLAGHASTFLALTSPSGTLVGLDADTKNLAVARERLAPFGDRVRLLHANFAELPTLGLEPVDVLFADLGLSSPHIDHPERGFTFRADGPLDLRFDQTSGLPVSEMLARAEEHTLVMVFRQYGELKDIRRLIASIRTKHPTTTKEMVACAEEAYGWKAPKFLPQVFQALRMWVNDELGALDTLLRVGPTLLKAGGRMAVISYHSLEDRPVKQMFKTLTTPEKDPITGRVSKEAPYELVTAKPIRPSEAEIQNNQRARSALLRIIRRTPS